MEKTEVIQKSYISTQWSENIIFYIIIIHIIVYQYFTVFLYVVYDNNHFIKITSLYENNQT